jgi:hypothetical protein
MALIVCVLVTGCAAAALGGAMLALHGPPGGDAKKNFENMVGARVGKDISSHRYTPVSSRVLEDGNTELKYSCCSKTCFYYYVVDKGTNVISSWKYEGDCRIVP